MSCPALADAEPGGHLESFLVSMVRAPEVLLRAHVWTLEAVCGSEQDAEAREATRIHRLGRGKLQEEAAEHAHGVAAAAACLPACISTVQPTSVKVQKTVQGHQRQHSIASHSVAISRKTLQSQRPSQPSARPCPSMARPSWRLAGAAAGMKRASATALYLFSPPPGPQLDPHPHHSNCKARPWPWRSTAATPPRLFHHLIMDLPRCDI